VREKVVTRESRPRHADVGGEKIRLDLERPPAMRDGLFAPACLEKPFGLADEIVGRRQVRQ